VITIGSLFSGIGGLELGLEWAGLGPVLWQVELDPFCRAVLAKHWPNVTRFNDITQPRDYPHVDLICGGFPCQDVSDAGARRGLKGERSSLWWYFAKVVEVVRPAWVVVENVAQGAVHLWLPTVRRHLCELGYRATPVRLSAADVGAHHLRRRVFVVAHAHGDGKSARAVDAEMARLSKSLGNSHGDGRVDGARSGHAGRPEPAEGGWWAPEPAVGRVAHGVPGRLDRRRLRALGNAVVPQCAEAIGRMICNDMARRSSPPSSNDRDSQEKP
jgi:DNA (cytosine-5)-methyltransferase 1